MDTQPRLVVYSARWKALRFLTIGAAFAAFVVAFRLQAVWIAGLYLLVFALLTLPGLIRRRRIVLTAQGFTVEGPRPASVNWSDVEGFFVWRDLAQSEAAWTWTCRSGRSSRPAVAIIRMAIDAPDETLGGGWTLSAKALAELMEAWRLRHSESADEDSSGPAATAATGLS